MLNLVGLFLLWLDLGFVAFVLLFGFILRWVVIFEFRVLVWVCILLALWYLLFVVTFVLLFIVLVSY